ncbi:MAG: PBECR2 nuclease fold domain-containing protein [Eubacteriales bacterium]|nr:PBECR2 nuclease fold domain-containing protein [Eubacteriales bacterium]
MTKVIGYFKQSIIDILNLKDISCDTPILLGESNVEHMKNRHPYEFDKYFSDISEIIAEPDYVGINPSDNSIGFVKVYYISGEYVRVAVRVTTKGQYFAKSLHSLSSYNAERYIERGTLKKLDK